MTLLESYLLDVSFLADCYRFLTILVSLLLLIASAGAMGRNLTDLEYQVEAGINGIRRIQSHINIRVNMNRVLLALAFLFSSLFVLIDIPMEYLIWVNRTIFIFVLVSFTRSAVQDWRDERKQMAYLVVEEQRARRLSFEKLRDGISQRTGETRSDLRVAESESADAGDRSPVPSRRSVESGQVGALASDPEFGPKTSGSQVVSEPVRDGGPQSGYYSFEPDKRPDLGE